MNSSLAHGTIAPVSSRSISSLSGSVQFHITSSQPPKLLRIAPPPLVPASSTGKGVQNLKMPGLVSLSTMSSDQSKINVTSAHRQLKPNPTIEPPKCAFGIAYRVECHRKYLGAEFGFLSWKELDPKIQSSISCKTQNQYIPDSEDLICQHHLMELSYQCDKMPSCHKGPCKGYGNVHKMPVMTTRLGVLSYYNNIAGKNCDVLPGKFVCTTCARILRSGPSNLNSSGGSFKIVTSETNRVPISVRVPQRNEKIQKQPLSSRTLPRLPRNIRIRQLPVIESDPGKGAETADFPVEGIEVKAEVEEETELFLEPCDISVGGPGLLRPSNNTEPEVEKDPLDLSDMNEQYFQSTQVPPSEELRYQLKRTAPKEYSEKTVMKKTKTNQTLHSKTQSSRPSKNGVRSPNQMHLTVHHERNCSRFQKFNDILLAAGVPPLLESNSHLAQDICKLKTTASQKLYQLLTNCLVMLSEEGINLNLEEVIPDEMG